MKRTICLLLLGFISAKAQEITGDDTYEKALSGFSNKLYKEVADGDENVLISPFSVHAVLSMVYQGADGTTKKVLGSELSPQSVKEPKDLAELYQSVIRDINTIQNVTLKTANKIYVKDNVQLENDFDNVIKSQFLSEVQQLNFKDSAASVGVINNWVENQTNKKITNLLQPNAVNENTRIVLVNAIYFKGDWNKKFESANTKTEPFYNGGLDSGKKDVEIMHQLNTYSYSNLDDLDAALVYLPYKNPRVNLVVILPNKRDGLKEVEKKLVGQDIQTLLYRASERKVKLGLPKFKIETTVDLVELLKRVGLGEIFDQEKANFSRILTNDEDLYVDKAVQKAFLEINEEGSEAAATTSITVGIPFSAPYNPPPLVVMQIDHPFIFFIVAKSGDGYRAQNRILFQGRINSL